MFNFISLLFPDRLRDMEGYTYRLILSPEFPRLVFLNDGTIFGEELAVFNAVISKQNARSKVTHKLQPESPRFIENFNRILSHNQADLSLNTGFFFSNSVAYRESINTYDENGYCALIPVPKRLSFLNFLLTPFDAFSWISMMVTIFLCAVLWKLLKAHGSDSALYFLFGTAANFLGQSIPFGRNRHMQVTLLQLCILMTFIMGNAYQSLIIASMAGSRSGIRMTTFIELFNSNTRMMVDSMFYKRLNASGEFASVIDRMEIGRDVLKYESIKEKGYAIIARCEMINIELNVLDNDFVSKNFYMLPDKMMNFCEKFMLAPRSPFYDELQKYFGYVFESGIRQVFKQILKFKEFSKISREKEFIENEDFLLTMDDLYGIFYIILVGFLISFTCFLFEIFYHDFWINYKTEIRKNWSKMWCKRQRRRFRIIQVRPFGI